MSKKGDHKLLPRLLTITNQRLGFATEVRRIQRQQQWLVHLAQLFDAGSEMVSSEEIQIRVDAYLHELMCQQLDEQDAVVATHINTTIRNLWWGRFVCYDVPGLPRTNNNLERFLRRLKTTQRRITGRKRVHDFIIRYGTFAAFMDFEEPLNYLLQRLTAVSQDAFLEHRSLLQASLLREAKRQRFRRQRKICLAQLELQWEHLQSYTS